MENRSRIIISVIFFASIIVTSPARADYHYASHEGSDEYPYTSWETAANLIQDAVDATDPGDTVFIAAGEYYEAVQTYVHNFIGIIGAGMDSTSWYTDDDIPPALSLGTGCLVEGIELRHGGHWLPLDTALGAEVIVRYCRFINSFVGVRIHGGPTEIAHCIFDSCEKAIFIPRADPDIHIRNNLIVDTYGHDVITIYGYDAIIENNIIINPSGSDALTIYGNPPYCIIRNNIAVNGQRGFPAYYLAYNNVALNMNRSQYSRGFDVGYDDTLFNNLAMGCRTGVEVWNSIDCAINYNAFWNNYIDIEEGEEFDSVGNIFANPMLVSEDDYHLQAFSPLIDAGDPNVLDVNGSRSDIGAYGGPYGQSYEYQDLPPAVPDSLWGQVVADTIFLNWQYNTEADFSDYHLHRDTLSGFEPSVFNLISEPDTSYYVDADILPGTDYYYRISAIDNQGNESDYSDELEVLQTGVWNGVGAELPTITTIQSNYPNPFNSSTTIVYTVANLGPIPAQINIDIYDIMGRVVRSLVDDKEEVGIYRIVWDGKSDSGDDCPSGIYFARIMQWDMGFLGKQQKLVLLR